MLVGCSKKNPINWDVNENSDWEIWATGELVSVEIIKHEDCKHQDPVPGPNCWSYYKYTFNDGTHVNSNYIKDKGLVKVGTKGTLYKLYPLKNDKTTWFQWKPDVGVVSRPPSSAKKVEDGNLTTLIDYSEKSIWVESTQNKPDRYTPVLVKFVNDTLSVGYINNLNEWKLSINKQQEGGGKTIRNNEIIFWKSLDIR